MRYLLSTLLLLAFVPQTFACTNFGPVVKNFLDDLFDGETYTGRRTSMIARPDAPATIRRETMTMGFRSYENSYGVGTGRCSYDGSQCEEPANDEFWRYNTFNHCLMVGLTPTRITRASENELRFEYTRGGSMIASIYRLSTSGRVIVIKTPTDRTGTSLSSFEGYP